MKTTRRSFLKFLSLFPFVPKLPAWKAPVVKEVIEHTFIGTEDHSFTFNVAGLPLPIVHTDFTFAFRKLEEVAKARGVIMDDTEKRELKAAFSKE